MTCNSFTGGTGTGTRQVISIFHVKYLLCLSNGLFGLFKSVNRSIAVVRDVSSFIPMREGEDFRSRCKSFSLRLHILYSTRSKTNFSM